MLESLPIKLIDSAPDSNTFPYSEISLNVQPGNRAPAQDNRLRLLEEKLSKHQAIAVKIEQQAYEKAYAEGEKVGLELGGKRAEQVLEQMQQILDEAVRQLDEIREHASDAITDISGAIAEWLIGEITEKEYDRLLQMAKKASRQFPEMEQLKIALHPDDLASVKKLPVDSDKEPPLVSDTSMLAGSVRIFTHSRDVLFDPHACIEDFIKEFKAGLKENAG